MGQRSSVKRLDPLLRERLDSAIREDRATIDEIVAEIRSMGGKVSRSAVGRYVFAANEQAKARGVGLDPIEREIRVVAALVREILGRLG